MKKKLANISNNTQENTILIEILSEFLSSETQRFYEGYFKILFQNNLKREQNDVKCKTVFFGIEFFLMDTFKFEGESQNAASPP
jgi:hypothetical protein